MIHAALALAAWQALLNGLGRVLAFFYDLVPNYAVAIILLTVALRIVLFPLFVKQIRSMQAMQAIQPKVKALQAKYKGKGADGRQKLNEEMMALYKQHGVNPFSGCFPLLAQFPVLIALFAVLRIGPGGSIPHIPTDTRLYTAITTQHVNFLGTNLLCSAAEAGKPVPIGAKKGVHQDIRGPLNCGNGGAAGRIPYYVFALLMIGTTYYQQRQMTRASPQGSQQQQAITKIMPLLFGVWGYIFPAGLVIYWTTTNLVQIGQQAFTLPRIQNASAAAETSEGGRGGRRTGEDGSGSRNGASSKRRPGASGSGRGAAAAGGNTRQPGRDGQPRDGRVRGQSGARPRSGGSGTAKPTPGNARKSQTASGGLRGGGSDGGDRKKRRKR